MSKSHAFPLAKYLLLSSAMVSLYPVPSAAIAQEAATEEAPVEIVVVGTRASTASAINRKKRAGTVSDSIVADDIGQFPDKNVGEALSRITGVQLSRDFGEGVSVSIRGVEPNLNRVEINGLNVLGTSGGGTAGGERGADFRELPSEIIQSVDVFKGFTADMTEGGIGGTVSIKTRKPLDFRKPTVSGTLSYQKLSLLDGYTPRASLLVADKFLDDRLGVLLNVTYDKVNTRQDYTGNTEWVRLADFDQSLEKTVVSRDPQWAAAETWAECNGNATCLQQWWDYSPRTARYRVWDRQDKRLSADLTVQYQLNDRLNVWGSYNLNKRSQRLNDRNYGTAFTAVNRLKTGSITSGNAASVPVGIVVDENHNVINYTVSSRLDVTVGGRDAFSTSSRDFRLDVESEYLSGGFNYRGERLAVEFVAARSEANYADETNGVTLTTHSPGLQVAINPSNGVPTFTFAEGYSPSDINSFHAIDIEYRPSETDTKEDQYKLDVDYDLNWAGFTRFEAGLQYRKSGSLRYRDSGSVVSTGADLVAGTADDIVTTNVRLGHSIAIGQAYTAVNQTGASINSINYTWLENDFRNVLREASTTLPSPYFDGYSDVSGLPSGWLVPDTAAILGYVDTSNFNRNNLRRAPGSDGNIYNQIPAHDIEEKITAGYAKLNFGHNWAGLDFTGNFGVRVVKTEVTAAGLLKRRERRSTPTQANPDATTTYEISNTIVSINESYTDVLPSFNLSTWIIPNELTVRFGVAKVLARPKMMDLVPAANCVFDATGRVVLDDDFTDTCSAGNPNLDPYRATQYDLSGEWYPNRDTQVSIGLFYKDVKSYVVGRKLFTGVDYFSDGNLVDVTMPYNGQGAKLKGVEVAAKTAFTFLPGIWSGFGVDTSYTWSQADEVGLYSELDGAELPFPGLSEHSYNVTLWYDKGPLNARLAYNGRSEYLVSAAERSGNPVFRDGSEYLDAKATWRVNEGLSFFVEGKNLTNTAERSTSGSIRLNELAWPGQRYFFGVTYKR